MKFQKYLALSFLLCSSSISADNGGMKLCRTISSMAESTMNARQSGISMADTLDGFLKVITNSSKLSEDTKVSFREMAKRMVVEAYESPKYEVEEMRNNSINDFGNSWYLSCIK